MYAHDNDLRKNTMKCYLVGGAVRDALRNKPIKERDWVVVGADAKTLLDKGFLPVGKDFPVFLHPDTKEEYALARTERKQGHGYKGFTFYANPNITLEQDLTRRDLTINAMAQDPDSDDIIDPFGGQKDLANKMLRHVSEAFSEDPLRVLRAARFTAQLEGFTIHPSTQQAIETIRQSGELKHLTPERVWQECLKALNQPQAANFFSTLHDLKAYPTLFPEYPYRPIQTQTLNQTQNVSACIRFACWSCHEKKEAIMQLSKRLNIPTTYRNLALKCAAYNLNDETLANMNETDWMHCFNALDLWRQPEQLKPWLTVMQYKAQANQTQLTHGNAILTLAETVQTIRADAQMREQYQGPELGRAIEKKRKKMISDWIKNR